MGFLATSLVALGVAGSSLASPAVAPYPIKQTHKRCDNHTNGGYPGFSGLKYFFALYALPPIVYLKLRGI